MPGQRGYRLSDADALLLARIEAGEHTFRPGNAPRLGESFDALVPPRRRLIDLRASVLGAALVLGACAPVTNLLSPAGPRFEGHYARPASAAEPAHAPIRVVTFNIRYAREIDRAIGVLQQDSLRGADVLALQEMDDAGLDRIARTLGLNYAYFPAISAPKAASTSAPRCSRHWPIERSWKVLLPHGGWIRGQRRTATAAILQHPGNPGPGVCRSPGDPGTDLRRRAKGSGHGRAERCGRLSGARGDRGRFQQRGHRWPPEVTPATRGPPSGSDPPWPGSPGTTSSSGASPCRRRRVPVWSGTSMGPVIIIPSGAW